MLRGPRFGGGGGGGSGGGGGGGVGFFETRSTGRKRSTHTRC